MPHAVFRDFHNGTSGLATVGALCRPRQNSGFITLLNHGQQRETAESVLTLAHELGHSLGADHDQEVGRGGDGGSNDHVLSPGVRVQPHHDGLHQQLGPA